MLVANWGYGEKQRRARTYAIAEGGGFDFEEGSQVRSLTQKDVLGKSEDA